VDRYSREVLGSLIHAALDFMLGVRLVVMNLDTVGDQTVGEISLKCSNKLNNKRLTNVLLDISCISVITPETLCGSAPYLMALLQLTLQSTWLNISSLFPEGLTFTHTPQSNRLHSGPPLPHTTPQSIV
jgi:hypothetical protein